MLPLFHGFVERFDIDIRLELVHDRCTRLALALERVHEAFLVGAFPIFVF